jgi:uncharacterized protein (DUF2164 family)
MEFRYQTLSSENVRSPIRSIVCRIPQGYLTRSKVDEIEEQDGKPGENAVTSHLGGFFYAEGLNEGQGG